MRLKHLLLAARGVLLLALVAHFSIVALHLLPENPLQHQFKRETQAYIFPFFGQTWKLFAPNPVNSNLSILVQFHDYRNGQKSVSPWLDVCEPMIEERRDNFWSPAQRILKTFSGSVINLMENRNKAMEYVSKNFAARDSTKSSRLIQQSIEFSAGHRAILSYSTFTHNAYLQETRQQPDSSFVEYRILDSKFPRFSKRHLNYFDKKNYTYQQIKSRPYRIL